MGVTLPFSMTGSIRLHVTEPLSAGAEIAASPGQAHYLGSVMRRGVGDAVVLFNGIDGEWQARLASIKRDRAVFVVEQHLRAQATGADLWLVFAPVKRDATDLIVEKATELGVSAIQPVLTERSNTGRINAERFGAIAVEAAEQCERLSVPRIAPIRQLLDMLADWPAERRLVVAAERAGAPRVVPMSGPCALLVGPEGGFTPRELDVLGRHAFVSMVTLGPLILRAETAAIVGLALLQAGSGDQSM
jgi:16S rRNA (uracil1498-N3)-methyltransferase